MMFWGISFLAGVGFLALAGCIYEKRAESRDAQRFPPPGRRVDVGSHKLHLLCMGEKQPSQPTVILESGNGAWSNYWRAVQPEVARFARVCAYDRAGFGWSEAGPTPRTPERIVTELHALLEEAGETAPYILVGHSMGGPLVRLFYARYPQDIAGMVWIDSAHEDMLKYISFGRAAYRSFIVMARVGALLAHLGLLRLFGKRRILSSYISVREPDAQAALIAQTVHPGFLDTLREETAAMTRTEHWARAPRTLDSLPVISIEAQYGPDAPKGYSEARWQAFRAGWRALHDDLSSLSSDTRRVAAQSDHNIMAEQPDLVIQAIKGLSITSCSN